MELNVEQEEYIGVLSPEAGIKMDISTQGEMPFPLERGMSLAPGYATMIGLRKVRINESISVKHCTAKFLILTIIAWIARKAWKSSCLLRNLASRNFDF